MLARRMLPGLVVAAGVTLITLAIATPALAADVEVDLRDLSSSITAGGNPGRFSGRVQNNGDETFPGVQRVITIQMDGLTPEGVHLARTQPIGFGDLQKESVGDGVRFVDSLKLPLGNQRRDTVITSYRIWFTQAAPVGSAVVIFEAFAAGQSLGADSDDVEVRAPRGSQPSPTKDPVHTDPPPTGGVVATPGSLAPIDGDVAGASGGESGGVPVVFYVLGGVLVLAGGAILWLLFHAPRPALVESGYADGPDYQGSRASTRALRYASDRGTAGGPRSVFATGGRDT